MQHPVAQEQAGLTLKFWKHDLPASIVVFLVALPLCMGIAIASGAPVTSGLVTGIVGGLVAGLLAGSPLQVSGPAAGLTVIVYALIVQFGIEKLGVCVLAAGALQLLAGYLRLGQWFRAVSPAVIQGMLAGIGLLIFSSQFHVMLDDKPKSTGWENFATIPQAIMKTFPLSEMGSTAERTAQTEALRAVSLLHLEQNEIDEEVHNLLSGIEQQQANGTWPDAPPGVVPLDHAPMLETPEQRQIASKLHQLVSRQEAVLAELEALKLARPTEQYTTAHAAVTAALADLNEGDIFAARLTQDTAEQALRELLDTRKNHGFAALIGILTIATLISWKALSVRHTKYLPPALVAVVIATMVAYLIQLPVLYVEVPNDLTEEIYFPTLAKLQGLLDWQMWILILQIAIIGSAETLLCAAAVDRMHTGPRTGFDRELKAQGIGNMICGLLSALPMTGVIVRSTANVQAGAKTRLSSILHGLWLLVFVCFLAALLRLIPTAALAAVLVYTGYKLIDFTAIKLLARRGKSEVFIYAVTAIAIVATDLLTGVLIGLALSIAKLIYVFSHLEIEVLETRDGLRWILRLNGSATFLRLPALAAALEKVPTDAELMIDVEHLDYIDGACRDLLEDWQTQYQDQGARLILDTESLQARFWRRRNGDHRVLGPAVIGAAHAHQKQRPI